MASNGEAGVCVSRLAGRSRGPRARCLCACAQTFVVGVSSRAPALPSLSRHNLLPKSPSSPIDSSSKSSFGVAKARIGKVQSTSDASKHGDVWRTVAPSPLSARSMPWAFWTGSDYLVWGGHIGSTLATDGAFYDPVGDSNFSGV